jgi:ABC-type multidrug transport system ATPase subunit
MAQSNILTFDQVSKSYGNIQALQSLSFNITEGKIIGLIGANGAGKSTSMRLIVRYLNADAGAIYFRQTPIDKLKNEAFPIAYIPDTPIY